MFTTKETETGAFPNEVKYFMFRGREDEMDKFIKMKVTLRGPIFIFISPQESVGNTTHLLELKDSKLKSSIFLAKKKQIAQKDLEEIDWGKLENGDLGIWIFLQARYIHIGIWNIDDGFTTLGALKIMELSSMNFIGFSSFSNTDWIISNGYFYSYLIPKTCIYFFSGTIWKIHSTKQTSH